MDPESMNVIERINGVPMISNDFNAPVLMSLVAHYRHTIFSRFDDLADYLSAVKIIPLYQQRNNLCNSECPEVNDLNDQERQDVKNAIENLLLIMPEWICYFSIPVVFKKNDGGDNIENLLIKNIPQVVYLEAKAFKCAEALEEVIIREIAHVWLGLIDEIVDFQEEVQRNYTLPSGKTCKDASEVIFSSHSAACLLKFLERKLEFCTFSGGNKENLSLLQDFFSGCVAQMIEMSELKAPGKKIVIIMQIEVSNE